MAEVAHTAQTENVVENNPENPPATQPAGDHHLVAAGFNADQLKQALSVLGEYGPSVFVMVQKFIDIFSTGPQVSGAHQAVRAGPQGERDYCKCLDCTLEHQLQALAMTVHLKHLQEHSVKSETPEQPQANNPPVVNRTQPKNS